MSLSLLQDDLLLSLKIVNNLEETGKKLKRRTNPSVFPKMLNFKRGICSFPAHLEQSDCFNPQNTQEVCLQKGQSQQKVHNCIEHSTLAAGATGRTKCVHTCPGLGLTPSAPATWTQAGFRERLRFIPAWREQASVRERVNPATHHTRA